MVSIFQVANLNRNRTHFRPSETHCQPDPTERNGSRRHVKTRNAKDLSKCVLIVAVLMVKDIIVIYRKNDTILVLISLETLFFASWKFNT